MRLTRATFVIDDRGCLSSSTLLVERAIQRCAGVARVYVNAATEMAYVTFDPDRCTIDQVVQAARAAGIALSCACHSTFEGSQPTTQQRIEAER